MVFGWHTGWQRARIAAERERERINEKKRERVLLAEEKRVIGLFSAQKP